MPLVSVGQEKIVATSTMNFRTVSCCFTKPQCFSLFCDLDDQADPVIYGKRGTGWSGFDFAKCHAVDLLENDGK